MRRSGLLSKMHWKKMEKHKGRGWHMFVNGFGAAATLWDLQADPRLGEAISTYCTQVVPVLELKWPMLRPDAQQPET